MWNQEEWLQVVTRAPLISIDLVIQNAETGDLLLGRRRNEPAKDTWFVPGGVIRKNESLDHAFARLCDGELKLIANRDDASFLGVFEHFYDSNFSNTPGTSTHYVVLAYHLVPPISRLTNLMMDTQHSALEWWSLPKIETSPFVHRNTKAYVSHLSQGKTQKLC